MLIYDPEAQEQLHTNGTWRTYQPGVRVQIRPVTTADQRSFRKLASASGRFDQDEFDRFFWDHLVADYEGICSKDGQKLPLTPANKVAVFTGLQALGNWACNESDKLAEAAAKAEGRALENSGGSRAGKRTAPKMETSPSPARPAAKPSWIQPITRAGSCLPPTQA